jgi:uncharacterized protein
MAKQCAGTGLSCDDPPPTELLHAIGQFNRGEFFECHETLEALWLAEEEPLRRLYQGILQVGVAFHQQRRGSFCGTLYLLDAGIAHLMPFEPACLGVDVAALVAAARRCREAVAALGPERLAAFDRDLIPQIRLPPAP